MKKLRVSHLGSGLFVVVAVIIMITQPFSAGLDTTAQIMLGGILIALGIWIFKPFNLSFSAGGIFLAALSLTLGVKPAVVFSGFTQSAIWTLIPAFFFGYALQKTGLGKRIALGIFKLFKPTYLTLVLAFVAIGVILSILTPSIALRIAVVMPIAMQCCELCVFEKGSKGSTLILLTAFSMAVLPGSAWLTGSLWGPVISGMINAVPETQGLVTFGSWFNVAFLPMMIASAILVVAGFIVFKPKEKLSTDCIEALKTEPRQKLSRKEIITAVILVLVFTLFLTGSIHGLPDAAICLTALFILFLCGVLDHKDWGAGVNWDLIIFSAMALGLGAILADTGISAWLAEIVVPALAPIAGSPWLFMFAMVTILFLWRFFDVAFMLPTIAILAPILPTIQETYGISPLVWVVLFVMAGNCFFATYQNAFAIMSRSITGEGACKDKHFSLYGAMYFAACLVSLAVAIPIWTNAGLFG